MNQECEEQQTEPQWQWIEQ